MKSWDRMNGFFPPSVKERPAGGLITELYDKDGTVASLGAGLVRVCSSFYFKLNDTPLPNERTDDICVGLLNRVQCIFSLEAQRMLEVPIIEEELTTVVQFMPLQKESA